MVRSMIFHLDCELSEENLKTGGACTIMKCLMEEDEGTKERKVG